MRAGEVLAGKQSNFRRGPVGDALISDYAEGFRVFDVDGRDYIDFVLGMGPAIWGYSNKEYEQSVIEQMSRQFSAASSVMHTTQEIMLAEKIVEHVPCAELVRFGLSGSEVDQLAMRLARGYTGKDTSCAVKAIIMAGWTMCLMGPSRPMHYRTPIL